MYRVAQPLSNHYNPMTSSLVLTTYNNGGEGGMDNDKVRGIQQGMVSLFRELLEKPNAGPSYMPSHSTLGYKILRHVTPQEVPVDEEHV